MIIPGGLSKQIKGILCVGLGVLIVVAIAAYGLLTVQRISLKLKTAKESETELALTIRALTNSYEEVRTQQAELKLSSQEITRAIAQTQGQLARIRADRDNLRLQTQKAGLDQSLFQELSSELEQRSDDAAMLREDYEEVVARTRLLRQRVKQLHASRSALDDHNRQLAHDKSRALEQLALLREDDIIERSENAYTEAENEKKILQKQLDDLRNKINGQLSLNDELRQSVQRLDQTYQRSLRRYKAEVRKSDLIEEKVEKAPARFAELSRQNMQLLERTAGIHYNLGVYYLDAKQYARALKEFRKTIRLKPKDAQAHYNLGYLYAGHIIDRKKAIDHFRRYLTYAEVGDKDRDWVEKYIATWQSWSGDEPMR